MAEFGQSLARRRSEAVNEERDRRIRAGFNFAGRPFDYDEASQTRIAGASIAALGALMAGALPGNLLWHGDVSPFVWIDGNNGLMEMDAQTCFAFGQAAMTHESAHIFAAKALKDTPSSPADWTADANWPMPGALP